MGRREVGGCVGIIPVASGRGLALPLHFNRLYTQQLQREREDVLIIAVVWIRADPYF